MIDKAKTLASFYLALRCLFDPDPEKYLIVYFRDGRQVKVVFKVEEVKKKEFKLIKNA